MRQRIRINENQLRQIVKESVKRLLKESEFGNLEDNEYYQDALEALEMSDCGITFDEWYPAFQDELEPEEAKEIFKTALKSYPIPW